MDGDAMLDLVDGLVHGAVRDSEAAAMFQCAHYKRKCRLVAPCCNRLYNCRFCHDEQENHVLDREGIKQVECMECHKCQEVRETCSSCGIRFGEYFCLQCKLYDDEDKQQFHCPGCRVCRVGGEANRFHCDRCDMCLPNKFLDAHNCVENASKVNCPVCLEDVHTSRIPSQIPPCHHLLHMSCFKEMVANDHYACPTCGRSMIDMAEVWKEMDEEIEETQMPVEYKDLYASIQCKDCFHCGVAAFHVVGMKCGGCGGYNTTRDKGPLVREDGPGPAAVALVRAAAVSTPTPTARVGRTRRPSRAREARWRASAATRAAMGQLSNASGGDADTNEIVDTA
jgi:RING finger/CHY zinc finger protein 1